MNARRCPDCGVSMEETDYATTGGHEIQLVLDDAREGLLGSLGVNERADVTAYLCPECGLVRLYADD